MHLKNVPLRQFKVDRLQIILVAKNIYIYVSQLFISRMMQLIHEGLLHKTVNKNNEPTLTIQQVNRVVLT